MTGTCYAQLTHMLNPCPILHCAPTHDTSNWMLHLAAVLKRLLKGVWRGNSCCVPAVVQLQSVASSPASLNTWQGGDSGQTWAGLAGQGRQAALQAQAQALALQLSLAGGLDPSQVLIYPFACDTLLCLAHEDAQCAAPLIQCTAVTLCV